MPPPPPPAGGCDGWSGGLTWRCLCRLAHERRSRVGSVRGRSAGLARCWLGRLAHERRPRAGSVWGWSDGLTWCWLSLVDALWLTLSPGCWADALPPRPALCCGCPCWWVRRYGSHRMSAGPVTRDAGWLAVWDLGRVPTLALLVGSLRRRQASELAARQCLPREAVRAVCVLRAARVPQFVVSPSARLPRPFCTLSRLYSLCTPSTLLPSVCPLPSALRPPWWFPPTGIVDSAWWVELRLSRRSPAAWAQIHRDVRGVYRPGRGASVVAAVAGRMGVRIGAWGVRPRELAALCMRRVAPLGRGASGRGARLALG